MEILYLASSVLCFFFLVILLGKKGKTLSDRILLAWFVLLFSNVFSFYLITRDSAPVILIAFLDSTPFIHGPVIWFYTAALTGNIKSVSLRHLIHLIPFVIFFVFSSLMSFSGLKVREFVTIIFIALKFILPGIYIIVSLVIIERHRRLIPNIFSTINRMDLKWLSSILYGGIALILFGAITLLIDIFTGLKIPEYGGMYLNAAYSLCIMLLGYYGFRQTSIFIPAGSRHEQFQIAEDKTKNKDRIPFSRKEDDGKGENDYNKLLQLMDMEKPYTDPNLTLFMLAGYLGMTENRLSFIINSRSGYNFFEFINSYRVKMVISRMKNREYLSSTLLGLAFDSGFNSKASFNRAFRKFTGSTPSEYLHDLK